MKIGVIVDGDAEYRSLPRLLARTDAAAVVLHPLKADIQPLAPIGQIVASVKSRLKILLARNVDLVVILLDRETREECPGAFAKSIQEKLKEMCAEPDVAVVVKNRTFENWQSRDCGRRDAVTLALLKAARPPDRSRAAPASASS